MSTEPKWKVECENDDRYEWWVVLDGERFSFRCDFESGAKWLCGVLNEREQSLLERHIPQDYQNE
jgi:hypothetical protein